MRTRLFSSGGSLILSLAMGAVILYPGRAWAQAMEYSLTSAALKMAGVLALVLAVLLGLVYLLKKFSPKFGRGALAGREMDLLAQYRLGPKKTLAVVRVGKRLLLLGVTEASINLLTEIEDEEMIQRLSRGETGAVQGFGRILKRAKGGDEGADQ